MRSSPAVLGVILLLSSWSNSISKAEELGWAGRLGGPQGEQPYAIVVDSSGSFYIAGSFEGSCDFDPGPGSAELTSNGGRDGFVVKLDSGGRLVWARSLGSVSADEARAVAIDGDDDVWVVGYFQGTVDFDPGGTVKHGHRSTRTGWTPAVLSPWTDPGACTLAVS